MDTKMRGDETTGTPAAGTPAAGSTAGLAPSETPAGQGSTGEPQRSSDPGLEELRQILSGPDRQSASALSARVTDLERRTGQREELIAAIVPVLGDVIRQKIQDSRDEMIEALYPIIGQLIGRAVAEAIRDLARVIDSRMRTSFGPARAWRRLRARLSGVSEQELALRDVLPFRISELFLIHRETGLLLKHLSNEPETTDDSDLVSGMLTAIRDFAQDAFGRGQEGQLDEIQYGTRRILVESSRHAYLAVVVDGIEPADFRAALRACIVEVENKYTKALSTYDGDASRFAQAEPMLAPLLADRAIGEPAATGSTPAGQKRIIVGLAAVLGICLLAACVGSVVTIRNAVNRPATTIMIVITATPGPTWTSTIRPSATPTMPPSPTATTTATMTPTATATRAPTATATSRPTATATRGPLPEIQIGDYPVNVRDAPSLASPVIQVALPGTVFRVLGRSDDSGWCQVCCLREGQPGWIAAIAVPQIDLPGLPVIKSP